MLDKEKKNSNDLEKIKLTIIEKHEDWVNGK